MDKRCKAEIRSILKAFHFSKRMDVDTTTEEIADCVHAYQLRKLEFTKERRKIEAELKKYFLTPP
jgi:uncharacterized protein YeeX (DUF496 family)